MIIGVEGAQENPEHRCLNLVEPRIEAAVSADLVLIETVIAPPAYPLGKLLRLCRNATPIAQTTEILGWIKAEGCYVSEVPHMNAIHAGPMAVGAILDDK